jgi:hypothetical protein
MTRRQSLQGTQYCFVRYSTGWCNHGMVDRDSRLRWADHFLSHDDPLLGPASQVAFIGFCYLGVSYLPDDVVQAEATMLYRREQPQPPVKQERYRELVCDDCGVEGEAVEEMNCEDVNNCVTKVTLCPYCARERAADI